MKFTYSSITFKMERIEFNYWYNHVSISLKAKVWNPIIYLGLNINNLIMVKI